MSSGSRGQTGSFALPRSVIRWIFAGLLFSSCLVIVISVFSGVSLSNLASIGYLPFGLAAVASAAGLLVGVLRFRTVARGLARDPGLGLGGLGNVKLASHFLTLTTPSTTAGFLLSSAWLSRRGVSRGNAMWIAYFEMLIQIYVSSTLVLVAAFYALSKGAIMMASTLALISVSLTVAYSALFLVPALRGGVLPRHLFRVAARVIGEARSARIERSVQQDSAGFSLAARAMLSRRYLPLVCKTIGLTVVEAVLSGLALWFIIVSAGLKIDVFSSTLVAYSAIAIGAVPVSVGGSGVTELAMKYYLASVYGFSSWAAIVLWRVASYQVILGICGIAFFILMRRAMKSIAEMPRREPTRTIIASDSTLWQ